MTQNVHEITQELRRQANEITRAADILENASNGSGRTARRTVTGTPKTGRRMSVEARRRIALAQKKRWANWKVMRGGKTKAA
jgi:hypothetical protein